MLDVGGGTGIHAEWLVKDGYDVALVDPVPVMLRPRRRCAQRR
ncbi:methyltransferase domain-containing protein [Streptomyces niveus]